MAEFIVDPSAPGTEDYTHLDDALEAEETDITAVTGGHVFRCRSGASQRNDVMNTWVTLDGYGVDSTHFVTIEPFSSADRATSQFDEGKYYAELDFSSYYMHLGMPDYSVTDGIQFSHITDVSASGPHFFAQDGGNNFPSNMTIKGCHFRDGLASRTNYTSLICWFVGATTGNVFVNNCAINCCAFHHNYSGAVEVFVYNNTIINSPLYGIQMRESVPNNSAKIRNNLVDRGTSGDYRVQNAAATSGNFSGDATSPESANQNETIYEDLVDPANEDLTLNVDTTYEGTDLSADADYSFSTDINLETRSDWDAGAAEYISAAVTITVTDGTLSITADSPALTQLHLLSVAESLLSVAGESPTLAQQHSLAVAESLLTLAGDSPTLTTTGALAVASAVVSISAESPGLVQDHVLAAADALLTANADSPALIQAHSLLVADGLSTLTADSPALTQAYLLSVAESLLSISADSPALTQQHSLAVAESLLTLAGESPTISTTGILAVAGAVLAIAAESPGLVQDHVLAAADALLTANADSPALIQAHNLLVSDGLSTLTADSPTLEQLHALLVADGLLTLQSDNVEILTAGFLNVHDADLSVLAEAPVLTQAHVLVVSDALHAITAESPLIGLHLIVNDSALSVAADSPTLSADTAIAVQDALMSLSADGVSISQVHGLVVSDSLHSMLGGIPSLNEEGAPQSADRIIIVESYGKYILVARENRTIMVQ